MLHVDMVKLFQGKIVTYSSITGLYLKPTLILDEHTTDKVAIFVGSLSFIPFEYTYKI